MIAEDEVIDEREYIEEALFQQRGSDESTALLGEDSSDMAGSGFRRPSLFWLLPPFFFSAVMSGASIAPRLSLISDLLCRTYYSVNTNDSHSLLSQIGDVQNCNIAEISGQIARLSTGLNTTAGLLGALTAAKYGLFSDRHGRRYPIMVAMLGSFMNDLCYILTARNYSHLTIYFLFVGAVFDGLSGSFMSLMAASYSYTTDVVPSQRRAVAFGYLQCCFFGGIAIGPTLGGYLVKKTESVLIIFYLAMGVHACFGLYTLFILPESLTETRKALVRTKLEALQVQVTETSSTISMRSSKVLDFFNIFKALSVFFPSQAQPIIKRNLKLLMAIDVCLLLNMGAFTVILLYARFVFDWRELQQGYLLSLIGSMRVFVLLAVLPIIVRVVRGKVANTHRSHDMEHPPEGADLLDIYLIRFSLLVEVIGYTLMSLAQSSGAFYVAGGISATAGIGMPTLASVLTKHVPSTQTGQLLGAVALMQSLNRVVSPLIFGLLYSATVSTHPATCFVVLAVLIASGLMTSLFLRASTSTDLDSDHGNSA